VQVEVVKVVLWFRSRILDVAKGRLDRPVGNLNRPNEIGEMSRAWYSLQGAPRERETQAWTKAQVAALTQGLHLAEDFDQTDGLRPRPHFPKTSNTGTRTLAVCRKNELTQILQRFSLQKLCGREGIVSGLRLSKSNPQASLDVSDKRAISR
jgi:hypothetical protein